MRARTTRETRIEVARSEWIDRISLKGEDTLGPENNTSKGKERGKERKMVFF